jgi:hypothetical protein
MLEALCINFVYETQGYSTVLFVVGAVSGQRAEQ